MDKIDAITILRHFRVHLFAAGGVILGLSLASILKIDDYDDRLEFAFSVAMPLFVLGILLMVRDMVKQAWRLFREEDAEWDRMLNAGPRKWDDS
jgi:hypothetical protein